MLKICSSSILEKNNPSSASLLKTDNPKYTINDILKPNFVKSPLLYRGLIIKTTPF